LGQSIHPFSVIDLVFGVPGVPAPGYFELYTGPHLARSNWWIIDANGLAIASQTWKIHLKSLVHVRGRIFNIGLTLTLIVCSWNGSLRLVLLGVLPNICRVSSDFWSESNLLPHAAYGSEYKRTPRTLHHSSEWIEPFFSNALSCHGYWLLEFCPENGKPKYCRFSCSRESAVHSSFERSIVHAWQPLRDVYPAMCQAVYIGFLHFDPQG
jgi:hypothetical protein